MADEGGSVVGMSPPPRKTDVLFGPGQNWPTNACISHYGESELVYRNGYRRAALLLAERVCETEEGQDHLVYPIVYLYRHHVELVLKSVIGLACNILDRALTDQELGTLGRHDLAGLWKVARPLLDPVCDAAGEAPLPMNDLEGVEAYIQQLHEHDPDGQRFRYATTKARRRGAKSSRSLRPDLRHINIRNFAFALEKLADYLGGIESWLDQIADWKAEMLAESEGVSW